MALKASAQSFESLKRPKGKTELYVAVEKALSNPAAVPEGVNAIASAKSLTDPYDGKTPIYLILDFLATHKKQDCGSAEKLLAAFVARKDFDVNLRYGSLLPPLAYLIRENNKFLRGSFSKEYISDSVLQMMIEKGAHVDTYAEDGSTLLSFAMDTESDYLKSFLIEKGLDAHHMDNSGRDDIYKLIENHDLKHIRQLIEQGMPFDINLLKNNPRDFVDDKELYNYIAEVCASKATSYEDLVLFRKKFADKKHLVANKYQAMASSEGKAAKNYDAIVNVEKRFPDLPEIIDPMKFAIYQQDCRNLDNSYQNALAHAKEGKPTTFSDNVAAKFVETYGQRYSYDPNNKVPLAEAVADYAKVTEVFSWFVGDHYSLERSAWWGLSHYYDFKEAERGREIYKRALQIINQSSTVNDFNSYYSNHKETIEQNYSNFINQVNKNIAKYNAEVQESNRNRSRGGSYSSSSSSKDRDDEKEESKMEETDVDVENMKMPNYTFTSNWYTSQFVGQGTTSNKYGENQYRNFRCDDEDKTTGKILKVIGEKYFWAVSSDRRYETEEDAVYAEYVWVKYRKVREKGHKPIF